MLRNPISAMDIAFELKKRLVTAPITLHFELTCDASDFLVGAVLGQRKNKVFHAFYYASRTLTNSQLN
ncbi:Retrovirus-related Pol polyprotein from transposon 17.6 [Gossypium australe]|uniref:Retrovirus-related Pol polyprotein from transposon 17.6 n=1 Tax=Gossypium australe TaxID=47621 RepID=A0A5B6VNY0_9ROSI|nr:Retrovirus-related Pol polyprotein from transposon 17.6 [Gossypium australe]